jgi:hypothetical protein
MSAQNVRVVKKNSRKNGGGGGDLEDRSVRRKQIIRTKISD